MELWLARAKLTGLGSTALLAKARQELVLKAMQRFELPVKRTRRQRVPEVAQPAELRQVSEGRLTRD
jgi:hypothetical protein